MADRPNILILMTDQQKATAIGLYGNPDVPTPALERLAARGVRYDRCYTPHPLCVPARVSLWTGRYPHRHGARTNEIPMPPEERHLARILHEAGYTLALFGKDHCFRPADEALFAHRHAFSHGGPDETETEEEAAAVRWIRSGEPGLEGEATGIDPTIYGRPRINPYPAESCPTALLARRAVRFIEEHPPEEPFCAWVSFPDPHEPYQCPLPYAALHPPGGLTLPPWRRGEADDAMERTRVFRHLFGSDRLSEAQIRLTMSVYYGMIRFVDDAVGRILDALDRRGLAEGTIVVFCSDHGDYAGEHHAAVKSAAFYDCLTRVPLLLSWPGRLPEGATDRNLVSLLDVLPTCLGLAGVPVPPGLDGRMLPGTGADPPRDAVFAEYGAGGPRLRLADLPRLLAEPWPGPVPLLRWREAEGHPAMVRMDRYKYVYDPDDETDELYDLEADPWELTNRARDPAYAAMRGRLRDRLLDWALRTQGGSPAPLYFDPATGRNAPEPFVPAQRDPP
jgi:arylsulfatase A-like enzyme